MLPVWILGAACCVTQPAVTVERVDYHGWSGCYRMSNGFAELIYVPQVGRIMRYAEKGGQNVLWENGRLAGKSMPQGENPQWFNYGGDKLWPAPQSLWNWPPDPILDGTAYDVVVIGSAIVISGKSSPKSGVQFRRRISMASNGTGVQIENWMTNTSKKPQELAVWEITQTDNPDQVTVPLEVTKEMPLGWAPYDDKPVDQTFAAIRNGELVVHRNPRAGFKLGSASEKGSLTAQFAGAKFRMSVRKAKGIYPDGGKFLEVYANGDPDKYVELEITGPLTHLAPGETAELDMSWRIDRLGGAQSKG